ncbi:unnamed protein product [Lampetra fluviatilis]
MALLVSLLVAVLAIASSATAKPLLLSQQAERLLALRGAPYPRARPQLLAARLEATLPYEGAMLVAPPGGGGGAGGPPGPYGRGPGAMVGPPGAAGGRSRLAEAAGSQQQQQQPRVAGLADLSGPQLARLRQLAAEYAAEGQLRAALGYGSPGYPGAGPRAQQQLQQQQLQQLLLLQLGQQQQPELEDNLVEEEEQEVEDDDDDDENDDVEEEEEEEEDEVEPDAPEGELGYAQLAEALQQQLQQQQLPNTIAGEGFGQQQQQRLDEEALGRIVGYLFGSAADGYAGNEVRPRYRRDAQLQQQQQEGYGDGGDGVAADRRLKGAAAAAAPQQQQQQRARVKRVRRDAPPAPAAGAEPLIRVKRIDPSDSDERGDSNSAMSATTTSGGGAGGGGVGGGGGGARVTRRERRSVAPQQQQQHHQQQQHQQQEEALELRGLVALARASGTRLRRLRRAGTTRGSAASSEHCTCQPVRCLHTPCSATGRCEHPNRLYTSLGSSNTGAARPFAGFIVAVSQATEPARL